ncbi:ligand-binding protein SH3 [Candidatus Woesearchaeota archaeon]|nr:MAG: ligand-binding protein SH3 [Candidatus Woesearchaeota archaeon]
MNGLVIAVLLSMAPLTELRAGIPVGIAAGYNPVLVFVLCYLANVAVLPVVFVFFEFIHRRFMHHDGYRSRFDRYMERTRRKVHPYVEKYGIPGFALFVALPLPGTGAWTGMAAAWFLGMSRPKAFAAVAVGVFAAGLLVMGVTLGGFRLLSII